MTRGRGAQAQGLHTLQTRILTRGVELATEGGVVVYSTCRSPLRPLSAPLRPPRPPYVPLRPSLSPPPPPPRAYAARAGLDSPRAALA